MRQSLSRRLRLSFSTATLLVFANGSMQPAAAAELSCPEGKKVGSGTCEPTSVGWVGANVTGGRCPVNSKVFFCDVECTCYWDAQESISCPAGSEAYHGGSYGSCLGTEEKHEARTITINLDSDAAPCEGPKDAKSRCRAFFTTVRGIPWFPEYYEQACPTEICTQRRSTAFICCTQPEKPAVDPALSLDDPALLNELLLLNSEFLNPEPAALTAPAEPMADPLPTPMPMMLP